MAKLGKVVDMKVLDTESGEETLFKASTSPKKSTVGQSWFGGLNYKGIAKLQEGKIEATSEADYKKVLIQVFDKFGVKLDDSCFNRGERWDTVEGRERFKVFVDGEEFAPALSAKAVKRIEEKQEETSVSSVSVPEPAVADVSAIQIPAKVAEVVPELKPVVDKDAANVKKIKDYLAKKVPEATIMEGLLKKYPKAKAEELLAKAKGPKVSF